MVHVTAVLVLFFISFQHINKAAGKKYEDGYQDVLAVKTKLQWNPKINSVFANKNMSEIKHLMGISATKKLAAEKAGGRKKADTKKPVKNQVDRANTPQNNSDMSENASKYNTNSGNLGFSISIPDHMQNGSKLSVAANVNSPMQNGSKLNVDANVNWKGPRQNGSKLTVDAKVNMRHPIRNHSKPIVDANVNVTLRRRKRDTLPTNFDWRQYSNCPSLFHIRYQECGDCWAVSSSSVMSDRYCLFTWRNKFFSAQQMTICVYPTTGGCDGGWPKDAMTYYINKDVASGSDPTVLTERAGCLPYPSYVDSKSTCPLKCNSGTAFDLTKDGDYYEITTKNVTEIMGEIYNNGPVVAILQVFEDFTYLGTGIYHHATGVSLGYHAVRIIGYGQDAGVKYWIVANSWGVDWGDNGYFKILRGTNECGIEGWITAVLPAEAYTSQLDERKVSTDVKQYKIEIRFTVVLDSCLLYFLNSRHITVLCL